MFINYKKNSNERRADLETPRWLGDLSAYLYSGCLSQVPHSYVLLQYILCPGFGWYTNTKTVHMTATTT